MDLELIPLLYSLKLGYEDNDIYIDELKKTPKNISWQYAFRHPLDTNIIGACIFDVDESTGIKIYKSFFILSVKELKKIVPNCPFVYRFEFIEEVKEDVVVVETMDLDSGIHLNVPYMGIVK